VVRWCCNRILMRKAIGGSSFLMGGLDAVVFTGGIGEHDAATRTEVLSGLEGLGIRFDEQRNAAPAGGVQAIGVAHSQTKIYVIPAAEDRMIAWHVGHML